MDEERARERLLAERERLAKEVEEFDEEFSRSMEDSTDENTYDQHIADVADQMYGRELDKSLEGNAKRLLAKIDRALEKLEEGTYGICDDRGEKIGDGRLEAMPYATLCIECERRLEQR